MLCTTFLVALGATTVAAECSRETLIKARDGFFAAKGSVEAAGLAPGAKIALNNKLASSLTETPFKTLAGFTNLLVTAADTEICQIATFRVSSAQVLSTRLAIDAEGKISEVEFLQAVQGDQFFRPTGFPSTTPAVWSAPAKAGTPPNIPATWTPVGGTPGKDVQKGTCKAGGGAPHKLTRRELVYVAATYADGLRGEPWGSCIIGGSSCPRNENGVTTSSNCAVGAGNFGFLTRGRRWVADTETAVVLGAFYFDYGASGPKGASAEAPGIKAPGGAAGGQKLFLHEYFKVDAGKLAAIYAPMKNIPGAQAAANTFAQEGPGASSGTAGGAAKSVPKMPKGGAAKGAGASPKGIGMAPPTAAESPSEE
ncbi:hypothetical protein EJ08DRAFT_650787 [Tothia fuscella]|uniref:DUF8021 domain-containing protein n=1 Tax=Tothia fuscella TaxID=1048955 RepID=A0A9P4TXN3_9PEZI|nr:hypothetical protein EJ08DRAFT_650787 [Tothia fuscella]